MTRSINLDTADATDLAAILPHIDQPVDGVLAYDPAARTLRICSNLTITDDERVLTTFDGSYSWLDTSEPTENDWLMLAEAIIREERLAVFDADAS